MNTASSSRLCSCVSSTLKRQATKSLSFASSSRLSVRQKHTLPNLPYSLESNLSPFLSNEALRGTAVEWHQGQLDRLNDLTRGTPYANQSVAQTVIGAAKRREDALIFGHASEALNNGFFLSGLSPEANTADAMTTQAKQLSQAIAQSFGSHTSFINHFSSYAMGMFGTGYVWLVMDRVDNLAVLSTYGAGTVLIQGDSNRAPELEPFIVDESAEAEPQPSQREDAVSKTSTSASSANEPSSTRQYHTSARSQASRLPEQSKPTFKASNFLANVGNSRFASRPSGHEESQRFVSIHPLLCLSLHPHVYIPDYGIMGKEAYIKNFWKNVDWARAEKKYTDVKSIEASVRSLRGAPQTSRFFQGRHDFESRDPKEALNPNFNF